MIPSKIRNRTTLDPEGLSTIDNFSFGPDRALEKDLLLKLKNEII